MLKIANDRMKYETIERCKLIVAVRNAPHFWPKEEKKPLTVNEILPESMREPERELTPEEIEAAWWREAR